MGILAVWSYQGVDSADLDSAMDIEDLQERKAAVVSLASLLLCFSLLAACWRLAACCAFGMAVEGTLR